LFADGSCFLFSDGAEPRPFAFFGAFGRMRISKENAEKNIFLFAQTAVMP
jgi:hypothetical protein